LTVSASTATTRSLPSPRAQDRYDPGFICNASDNGGRYSFENQPSAVRWNCVKLGEMFALSPALRAHVAATNAALGSDEGAEWDFRSLCAAAFGAEFERVYHGLMRRKLGLGFAEAASAAAPGAATGGDGFDGGLDDDAGSLLGGLLETMQSTGADYTNTFRALAGVDPLGADLASSSASGSSNNVGDAPSPAVSASATDPVLAYLLSQTASAGEMAAASKPQVPLEQLQKLARVAAVRPELMIDVGEVQREIRRHAEWAAASKRTDAQKAADDAAAWSAWLARYRARLVAELPAHLRQYAPAASGGGAAAAAGMPPEAHAEVRRLVAARQDMMRRSNPRLVLRNWVAHRAIAAAEGGDYSEVARVLAAVQDPFGLADGVDGGSGVSQWFAPGSSDAAAAAATAVDLATSHVDAPNTADEGATRLPARGMTQPPSTCAVGGASGGGLAYAARPPPDMLSLKVT
jgi:serine/tyrosine/threonine adenylyltransferase